MAEIIDAEDGLFFLRIVGFGGDGHLFVWCTSTAANDVAGCTEGGVWSLAMAGKANPKRSNGIVRKALIVLDCIILGWTAERLVRHA